MSDSSAFPMLQESSMNIWREKYALRGQDGCLLESDPTETLRRVANSLGRDSKEVEEFFFVMMRGCYPAGRILSNAGATNKTSVSLINCTVANSIEDSMDGILKAVWEGGNTLKAGCGIGYDFSTIRPKGAYVSGAGATTTGVLPFMEIFDTMCRTVSSSGGRRGAQMGIMNVSHPDIVDFIRAKQIPGRFSQFNLSVGITDKFMMATKNDEDWQLTFNGVRAHHGDKVKARWLLDLITSSEYEYSEPGVLFLDTINAKNPLSCIEDIRTTNPCGEQPLPPNGACLLGSIDISRFIHEESQTFDYKSLSACARIFTRLLDRVVDHANLPLLGQREELCMKRRHGMGIMGVGTACALLGIDYDSVAGRVLVTKVLSVINAAGWVESVSLAKECGPAPIFATMSQGERNSFSEKLMPLLGLLPFDERSEVFHAATEGVLRFTHHTSIAPTGTIAASFGNNCSSGIEPTFAHQYTRNRVIPGLRTRQATTVFSAESYNNPRTKHHAGWKCSREIRPEEHLYMLIAAQRFVDSAISKTINVPHAYPYEQYQLLFIEAWEHGCKGFTTFREGRRAGVLETTPLVTEYEIRHVSDGKEETVTLPWDATVSWDGETTSVGNLFSYIQEYGQKSGAYNG